MLVYPAVFKTLPKLLGCLFIFGKDAKPFGIYVKSVNGGKTQLIFKSIFVGLTCNLNTLGLKNNKQIVIFKHNRRFQIFTAAPMNTPPITTTIVQMNITKSRRSRSDIPMRFPYRRLCKNSNIISIANAPIAIKT